MDGLDIFAFVVMFVIVAAVGVAIFILGKMPGDIARKRGHPQASAITACGWLGILTAGLLWPVALIWAYGSPVHKAQLEDDQAKAIQQLLERVTALEQKATRSENIQKGAPS